jgi:ATP synthase protein I
MKKNEKNKSPLQQAGVFVTIPFVLATPPLVGWWIGKWVDKKLNTTPYLMYALLILGLLAGAWECYKIVKEYGSEV